MFCPECGKKNKDSAKFCEECGTKLISKKESSEVQDSNKKINVEESSKEIDNLGTKGANNDKNDISEEKVSNKLSTKKRVLIGIGVIIVISIVGLNAMLTKNSKPEEVAKRYFEDVANARWNAVYGYYDLSEDEFISKSMYREVVKDIEKIEYSNFKVMEDTEVVEEIFESNKEDSDDEIYKTVVIQYAIKGSSDPEASYTVKLVKQQKKKFLFYDNWKVIPEDMIVKDFIVTTLRNLDVKFDNIKLDDKYIDKSSEKEKGATFVTYKIPNVFTGEHNVEITGEYIEKHNEELYISNYDATFFSFENPEIKKGLNKKLQEDAKEVIRKIYVAAKDNVKFKDLKVGYDFISEKDDEDTYEELKEEYEDLIDNLDNTSYYSDIEVTDFKMKEFEIVDENSEIINDVVHTNLYFDLDYQGKYEKKVLDKKEVNTAEGNTNGNISFDYIDGQWKISKWYFYDMYYHF